MKTSTKAILIAGAALLVGGGIAVAQDAGRWTQQGPGGYMNAEWGWGPGYGRHHGRRGGPRRAMRMFKRLDADGDGEVTREEALRLIDRPFGRVDTNKDGEITADEIDAELQRRLERMRARALDRFDIDGDGKITRAEVESPVSKRFALVDRNDDGKVTEDEARRAMRGMHGFGPRGWGYGMGPRGRGDGMGPGGMFRGPQDGPATPDNGGSDDAPQQ